ncbi:MAG TPA: right-handed parallel beta-helix repeat-containing protein [Anaerohalosphaeraceae bacterium]|nr:right-handed parallel beta-helix repeat-containing protein [Anaerohalosphaeraceae bacterium]
MVGKKTCIAAFFMLFVSFIFIGSAAYSESLYVADHGNNVFSFDIVNGAIEFRHSLSVPNSGGGIDLEIDDDHDILFRTVEFASTIDIIEAQSLTYIKTITLDVQPDAGIVYDAANSRLLCTKRNSNRLYIFSWDAALQTLTYQPPYVTLGQIQNACDLAINGDVLYVSEYIYSGTPSYSELYAYDISDNFSFIGKIDMNHATVSIDYNAGDDSVYGGAWTGHQNLIKRSFDPNTLNYGNIGTSATGVATNGQVAGRVFITSYRDGGSIEWWDLSDADPNDWELVDDYTNSNSDGVTLSGLAGLAVGRDYIEPTIILEKTDDSSGCVWPEDELTYTLCITNYSETETASGVVLIDYLPDAVDYAGSEYAIDPNFNIIPPDPGYHPDEHAYVWHIGNIAPQDSNTVTLTVEVNYRAEPGMPIENVAVATSDNLGSTVDKLETDICCWDSGTIIYVDKTATGKNNGTSWTDAYTELYKATRRAKDSTCTQDFDIYVAQGTYAPDDTENGFVVPAGVSVYGGYKGGLHDPNNRNPKRYETILTGLIDADAFPDADVIVSMGNDTLLSGFTVTKSLQRAIFGSSVDFTIEPCVVKENFQFGIYAVNCNTEVRWTTVNGNGTTGLYHQGGECQVTNSWCLRNGAYGIYCNGSTPTIMNAIVSESSMTEQGRQAIHIKNPTYQPKLYNLTLANNRAAGLHFEDDGDITGDPNFPDYPDLQNSILFFNGGGSQISGFNPDLYANFCCIQDCNTIGTTNFADDPNFAYQVDPNGVPDPNNYHLSADSICIDHGNPYLDYTAQVDIDGEGVDRKYGDYVDVGADEVYDCFDDYLSDADVHNDVDFDADGVVGLPEFALFSRAWLSHNEQDPAWQADPNLADPNLTATWNPICNLSATGTSEYAIDLADLDVFLEDWLWVACWRADLWELMAQQAMMSGDEQQMQSFDAALMATEIIQPEPTVEEQILQLQDAIAFLEQIWLEEPDLQQEISSEDWQAFMDAVYQNLLDLQTEIVQIE